LPFEENWLRIRVCIQITFTTFRAIARFSHWAGHVAALMLHGRPLLIPPPGRCPIGIHPYSLW
jgi:hypothetical protein